MEKNDNYIQFDEQVERYLRRRMTVDEERDFKQLLTENPDLKERARFTALMIREMRNAVEEESSENQKVIHAIKGMSEKQYRKAAGLFFKKKVVRLWPKVIKYAIAACIVGIVCYVGIEQYDAMQYKKIGNDPIYLAYEPMLGETSHNRGADESDAIPQEEKKEILTLFNEIEKGINLEQAVYRLEDLYCDIQEEKPISLLAEYEDDFAWYLSIGYLKLGEGESAIRMLESIIARGEPANTKQAKNLLRRIKDV